MADSFCSPTPVDILLEPLADSRWRVCDQRFPSHDKRRILGFIETTRDGRFELMELGGEHEFDWFTFDSLAEATAHLRSARCDRLETRIPVGL